MMRHVGRGNSSPPCQIQRTLIIIKVYFSVCCLGIWKCEVVKHSGHAWIGGGVDVSFMWMYHVFPGLRELLSDVHWILERCHEHLQSACMFKRKWTKLLPRNIPWSFSCQSSSIICGESLEWAHVRLRQENPRRVSGPVERWARFPQWSHRDLLLLYPRRHRRLSCCSERIWLGLSAVCVICEWQTPANVRTQFCGHCAEMSENSFGLCCIAKLP